MSTRGAAVPAAPALGASPGVVVAGGASVLGGFTFWKPSGGVSASGIGVPSLRVGVGAGTPMSVALCASARCGETDVVIGAELVGRGVELARDGSVVGAAVPAEGESGGADRLGMRTGELLGARGGALLAGRGGLLLGARGGALLDGRGIGVGMRAAAGGALGAEAAAGGGAEGAAGAAEG